MRILPVNEWDKLVPIFKEQGWNLPEPSTSFCVVEEDDKGEIIALQMCQLILAAEPHWEKEEFRGKVNWKKMGSELEKVISNNPLFAGVVLHATSKNVERMAELMGMEEFPCKTFIKEFRREKVAVANESEKEV